MAADARLLAGAALADALRDARATTLARTMDQDDAAWNVAQQSGVNLPAWELGHLAWFAEFWILRGPHRAGADGFVAAAKPPSIAGPDAIFDSARLAHGDRWRVALPSRDELATRLAEPARRLHRRHPARCGRRRRELLPPPRALPRGHAWRGVRLAARDARLAGAGGPGLAFAADARAPAHRRRHGRPRPRADAPGFAFDNEQPAMPARLAPFEIDATPLRNAEFVAFVEAGGYDDATLWPGPAGAWRARQASSHPSRWRRDAAGAWQMRWFDRWLPLDPAAPVIHVSAWEAEAYCRWAGRRLPHAAEWEHAAARRALRLGPRRLGMDRRRVPALPGLRRRTVRRLLPAVVRRSSRAARRRLRHRRATARPALSQLLRRRPQRRLRGLSHRRPSHAETKALP